MDIGRAAGIFAHYITLALGEKMTTDMHLELAAAVKAFNDAAVRLAELDRRTLGSMRFGGTLNG